MEKELVNVISVFTSELKIRFPFVNLRVSEVPYDDSIILFHDYRNADNDNYFIDTLLFLQEKYFWDNGIINIGISYDYTVDGMVYYDSTNILSITTNNIQSIFITGANESSYTVKVNNSWNDNMYTNYYRYEVA